MNFVLVGGDGFEPPMSKTADLQSAAITNYATLPWLRGEESNLRPLGYEPSKLPLLYLTIRIGGAFLQHTAAVGKLKDFHLETVYLLLTALPRLFVHRTTLDRLLAQGKLLHILLKHILACTDMPSVSYSTICKTMILQTISHVNKKRDVRKRQTPLFFCPLME